MPGRTALPPGKEVSDFARSELGVGFPKKVSDPLLCGILQEPIQGELTYDFTSYKICQVRLLFSSWRSHAHRLHSGRAIQTEYINKHV